MFSSQRFREGHALATASSAEVALPDDDAPSVGILCGIMHMRYDLVPQTLSTIDILNLALVCDKYACAMVVKPSVEVWVERELKTAGDQVRAQLMKAACLLRNTASIHRVGVQMVMRSTGPVNHKGETLHGIPRGLLGNTHLHFGCCRWASADIHKRHSNSSVSRRRSRLTQLSRMSSTAK